MGVNKLKLESMKARTKKELINWLCNFHNNCGFTDYFGYKMTIEAFNKEISKKKACELSEIVYSTNNEGQKFVETI